MKNLWIIISFLLLFSACADDAYQEGSTGKDSEMLVTLDLKVPGIQTTRLTGEEEEAITEVDLLAFDASGNYLYYKQGAKKGSYYEVTLKKTTEQQTFVVLANLRSQLGAEPTVGTAKADILKTIVFASTKTYTTLPMWGETKATISGPGTLTVKMLRAVARVDVKTNSGVNKSDFELTEVVVYNSLSQGRAVPDVGNMGTNSDGNPVATAPTLITPSASKNSKLAYGTTTNLFEREIYLSEYINKGVTDGGDRLCLVVGGKYKGGNATYYRIDFFGKETDKDTGKQIQVLKDILRNYRYNVEITSVSGPGYEKPDDAFNSTPINLEAKVVEWEEKFDMNVVGTDGTYILAVNERLFTLPKEEINDERSELLVYTDHAEGWTATSSDESWLTLSESGPTGGPTSVQMHVKANDTEANRTATIKVTAGKITINIIVTQTTEAGEGGNDPHTFTATNSSKYAINSIDKSFTFTSTGSWEIESVITPDDKTSLKVNSTPLKDATGSGSSTPVTVTLATDTDAEEGDVSITFVCTNGYFSNWENNKKVTITFKIAKAVTYSAHNGWAGSNIYWDGSKLTFADTGTMDKQLYQGVFFKYGSLVGLQCNNDWSTYSTCYAPTEWTKEESILVNGYTLDKIPYVTTSPTTFTTNRQYLLEVHNPSDGKGDICKYITDKGWAPGYSSGMRWRMPTQAEYTLVDNYTPCSQWILPNSYRPDGQTLITSAYYTKGSDSTSNMTSAKFAMAGSIWPDGDLLRNFGYYWSSTPINESKSYNFHFNEAWLHSTAGINQKRDVGAPVRCVLE